MTPEDPKPKVCCTVTNLGHNFPYAILLPSSRLYDQHLPGFYGQNYKIFDKSDISTTHFKIKIASTFVVMLLLHGGGTTSIPQQFTITRTCQVSANYFS